MLVLGDAMDAGQKEQSTSRDQIDLCLSLTLFPVPLYVLRCVLAHTRGSQGPVRA